jgi:hypothetical protein
MFQSNATLLIQQAQYAQVVLGIWVVTAALGVLAQLLYQCDRIVHIKICTLKL